ncbi:uncharacterized protein LOC124337507 isoform X1 [Daphnia pulicaria]|uniref:uncharacterized protein LOC124337507 isoform X1 n=1 Tax=Daphnia pulicaria TaxID=35523 RepID=UPI001EEA51C3|nr:uncharacterized protein LOC124337507 isoform X1 [Daphnia pulicaria]
MTAAAFSTQRLIGLRLLAGRAPATYWPSLVLPLLAVLVLLLCWKPAGASEFPERECCDDLILLPPAVDAGPDIRKTVPLGGNGGVGGTTSSSFSTEVPPHSSSEHPDTSNFLYPEFIPELSLDLGYPLPPPPLHPHHQHPHPGAPDGSNYVPTTTGTGLHQGQPASAILNCLLAHQLCAEDPSCKSIETVIQHICGPETVACSTTTVTKCQAGLRTLQAFPVFHPTCLCREPSVDPDCNAFRDSLFDHPCMVATQKERDLYPIHALPTCTHALDVCQKDLSCTRLYNDFREHCKLRSGVCRDKETCYNAWRGLRMTPLFGCFCPGNDQKKCERIYSFIYNNTCVGYPTPSGHVIRNRSESSVTATPLSDSTTTSRVYASRRMRRYLVRYLPHHLTPPPAITTTTTHLHNQSAPQSSSSSPSSTSSVDDEDDNELALDTTTSTTNSLITTTDPPSLLPTSTDVISTSTPPITTTTHEHHLVGTTSTTTSTTVTPVPTAHHLLLRETTSSLDRADDVAASWHDSLNRQRETDGRQIESRLMDSVHHHHHHGTAAEAGSIDVARFSHFLQSALTRTRIGYHSSSSSVSSIHAASAAAAASGSVAAGAIGNGSASYYSTSSSSSFNTSVTSSNHTGGDEVMDGGAGRVVSIYQSTCHRALTHCQSDLQCRKHLDPFLRYCNGGGGVSGMAGGADTCHRDLCMQALQGFYKDAPLQWSLEVAFCVCKKSQSRNDECLVAQERLHPDCARRPERYHLPPPPLPPASSGGGGGATAMGGSMASSSPALGTNEASPPHHTPACHHLAEECKAHPDCKPRLEFYVQACAVDIVTKGCAGPPSICRRAVLDILGTDLRTTCTCRTAQHLGDMAAMYDCTEWQRLLWLNPCVVEAQRDFHKIQGNLKVVTVPTPTLAPSTAGVDGSSATVRGRQTSSVEDDPLHHLFTIVPRRTLRPQETQQSPGEGGGQRFPMTSSTDVTSGSSSTVTWTTLTGTRFSTGSSTASGGPTTTEMITRPTIPAKYCTLERSNERVVHFPEGTIKRLYDDDDPDCSELCRCGAGQVVTCSISDCADRIPCQTSSAVYAHAATAFQAYRGECLCFSGTLVCARPDPGQYSLPLGVFLFVGYSRADEKAIYQFTHTNVSRSLVTGLDRLMYISLPEMAENECRMSIHDDKLEENLIFQIRLSSLDEQRVNNSVTLEMLTHEKSQCLPVANRLRHMISKRLPDIREDEALSIIKVADTATVLPEPRRSASANRHQMCWTILAAVWSSSLILTNRFYS